MSSLAQRFDEHQAPAAFRALIGVVSDWRIDVRIVNFDEQALAEMPYRQRYQARVRALGVPQRARRIANESYRVSHEFGD